MTPVRVATAFLRKDFLEEISYRFNFLLSLGGIVIMLVFLGAVSDFLGQAIADRIEQFKVRSFLEFLILGIVVYGYLETAVNELSRRIRISQTVGTLEALVATRTPLPWLILSFPLYPFARVTVQVAGYFLFGLIFYELTWPEASWLAGLALFALSIWVFGSVGLIFAALMVVFKRTDPVIYLFNSASALLGGVFYPVEALPNWLQVLAQIFPLTHSLHGIRLALLGSESGSLWPSFLILLGYGIVLFPLSILLFRWSLRRAMQDGTLTQY